MLCLEDSFKWKLTQRLIWIDLEMAILSQSRKKYFFCLTANPSYLTFHKLICMTRLQQISGLWQVDNFIFEVFSCLSSPLPIMVLQMFVYNCGAKGTKRKMLYTRCFVTTQRAACVGAKKIFFLQETLLDHHNDNVTWVFASYSLGNNRLLNPEL